MVSHWSLSDSESPQISKIFLSILASLNNAVIWMVFICPLISKFSSLFMNFFEIAQSALITISITVTFVFHSFLGFF